MKKVIRKILKEDRRQMYLDKIVQIMKKDFPLIKNLKDYGFYDQFSKKELNFVLSRIFGEPINKIRNSIFNKNGNELYIEYSSGFWRKSEYDNNGNEIYNEDSDGFWRKYEYDDNGKVIYYEDSDGYWEKSEYDDNGNIIYWENFKGDWIKREYDDNDNRIYYEDSNGYIEGDR